MNCAPRPIACASSRGQIERDGELPPAAPEIRRSEDARDLDRRAQDDPGRGSCEVRTLNVWSIVRARDRP